jgi:hypothetical protein
MDLLHDLLRYQESEYPCLLIVLTDTPTTASASA